MTLIERLTEAKRTGSYQGMLDAIPYAQFLGLTCAAEGDELVTTMRYAPHLIGNPTLPALHGGTLGALLESAAIFELLYRAETVVLPKTITLTVDYLRSAAPLDTHARGIVTRQGRRVTNVRVEAWQGDRPGPEAAPLDPMTRGRGNLVATAHAIFLVMREAP